MRQLRFFTVGQLVPEAESERQQKELAQQRAERLPHETPEIEC